jgi:hypothetical protein
MRETFRALLPVGSVTSASVLRGKGLSPSTIGRLVQAHVLLPEPRVRGVYRIAGRELSLHHDLLVVALCAPKAVFCLLSALRWHGFRAPCADIWLCLPSRSRLPDLKHLPLESVRPRVTPVGWETVMVNYEEVPMRFTSPAQTVADCFQYKTRVGLDVAVGALQDVLRAGAATMEDIWRCAKVIGVHKEMLPYVESIR